jgi:hydrogenase maturation protease
VPAAPSRVVPGRAAGENRCPILVLGLGNDILGDDAVGILAARALRDGGDLAPSVEVLETAEAGIALMELMEGRRRVLILDSIFTRQCDPGTILDLGPADFDSVASPSPHYAGLPEVLALAERLDIPFPSDIRIVAMEVEDPFEVREGLTPRVAAALPAFTARAVQVLQTWRTETASPPEI